MRRSAGRWGGRGWLLDARGQRRNVVVEGRDLEGAARQSERRHPLGDLGGTEQAGRDARQVLAPCAVGSLKPELGPGTFVVPDQVVDRTWGRGQTVYDLSSDK